MKLYSANLPFDRAISVPDIYYQNNDVNVYYNYECDDGSILYTYINFIDVKMFTFKEFIMCEGSDIVDFNSICQINMDKYEYNKNDKELELVLSSLNNYLIYFDDICCINILSRDFKLNDTTSEDGVTKQR